MKINKTKLDIAFKIVFSLSFILIALSVSYYFFIFLPKIEQGKFELATQEQEKEARCLKYQNNIKEKIQYENSLIDNPSLDHFWFYKLKELFFSKKLDTCIYVESQELLDGSVSAAEIYIIKDFYNDQEIKKFTIKTSRQFTGELTGFESYINAIKP